jgi:hypothetical protein
MSSNQTIEKLKQAAEYEKAGNVKKAFQLYSELQTDLNSPVWLKMKIQRLQGDQKTPSTSKALQHLPIANKPVATTLDSENVPLNSIEVKKDKIFDSLSSSWEEWKKEFGPGQLTIVDNGFALTSNGERFYLSKEFNFKSGRSYEVTVQLGEIKGEIGHLVAFVKHNGLEGDVEFLAKNAKANDSIVLKFLAYEDTEASLRIGLGTTTKVNGEAKLVVTGLCIYETILPENNYKIINKFCRDYIDPEIILPNLISGWNDYSEIDSAVKIVKNDKDFIFTKKRTPIDTKQWMGTTKHGSLQNALSFIFHTPLEILYLKI